MRNNKTAELVLTALFAAIIIIMAFTPLGYIPLVVINATIIHIPVILGSLFCGPKKGGFLGFIFGLTSFIKNTVMPTSLSAFVFSPVLAASMVGTSGIVKSAFICFVPRILVGILPYFVYIGVKKALSSRHKILWASVFNILIGVFLFLGARAFLLHVFDKKPLSDIALYAVSALVGWFVFIALEVYTVLKSGCLFKTYYFWIGFNLFSTMPSAATMIAATIASMTPLKLMTPPMIPSTAPASTLRAFAYASLYNTKIPPITSIVLTIAPVTPA